MQVTWKDPLQPLQLSCHVSQCSVGWYDYTRKGNVYIIIQGTHLHQRLEEEGRAVSGDEGQVSVCVGWLEQTKINQRLIVNKELEQKITHITEHLPKEIKKTTVN